MSSSPYDQHIEELLGSYRRERAQVGELQRRMRDVTATVTAPRQALKVTVNSQGEVTEIEFPTGAYKRMAPVELSQMISSTIQKARTNAMAEAAEVLSGHLPAGVSAADLLQGKADLGGLLPEAPPMADEVGEYVAHGRPGRDAGPRIARPPVA
ncbi:YbaB/EbfC family nucleoid-associated protein [Streptomyces chartreusis]|uniref:YbaB/EbfC family nucleoid-associated protein n=1 Tax=Streptomyces chartreusis TaxID=1969 RepID=A0A7I0Y8Y0_STRCX|nr:YbaB/EbfC family nucleoid-associated protein [Streptomyces chartreusis]QKZ15961.1 YbaB/EbfC family nucleoid-associated protein [Streptomyces chartreusis]